jgi:hypothetical protein
MTQNLTVRIGASTSGFFSGGLGAWPVGAGGGFCAIT